MPRMYSAYEFRRRAREAMLPVMSVLVLVMLIAMAPGLISNTLTMITGADPAALLTDLWTQERVGALFGADEAAALAAQEEFTAAVTTFLAAKWPILLLTAAVTLILGPVLTLGLNHTLLKALRREEFAVGTVFARLPVFFKAIRLTLMTDLRILLWSLPGTAVMLLGSLAMLWVPTLGMLLFLGGMVLTTVHSIQAAYRYRMAVFVMADAPETGINAALRRSCEVMNGRKLELFHLEFSFLGWRLLLSMAQTLLMGMLGAVIGMTVTLLASFFLQMYVSMAFAAFYQEYAVGPLPEAEQTPDQEILL